MKRIDPRAMVKRIADHGCEGVILSAPRSEIDAVMERLKRSDDHALAGWVLCGGETITLTLPAKGAVLK